MAAAGTLARAPIAARSTVPLSPKRACNLTAPIPCCAVWEDALLSLLATGCAVCMAAAGPVCMARELCVLPAAAPLSLATAPAATGAVWLLPPLPLPLATDMAAANADSPRGAAGMAGAAGRADPLAAAAELLGMCRGRFARAAVAAAAAA